MRNAFILHFSLPVFHFSFSDRPITSGGTDTMRTYTKIRRAMGWGAALAVVANIPPGGRKDDAVDVVVQALPNNNTSSLANGMLWRTTLKINGMADPYGAINEFARAQGNVFVNPAYAAEASPTATTQTA